MQFTVSFSPRAAAGGTRIRSRLGPAVTSVTMGLGWCGGPGPTLVAATQLWAGAPQFAQRARASSIVACVAE